MSKIPDYFQVICPVALKAVFENAACHFYDDTYWDTHTHPPDAWVFMNNGQYIGNSYPAGINMQTVTAAWINPAVEDSDPVFDALRMTRGPNPPLTNEEIGQLRAGCIIGIQQDFLQFMADNGMVPDSPDLQELTPG